MATAALFCGLLHITGLHDMLHLDNSSGANMLLILSLIIQLNDYSGTLDPHVSFNMENSTTLSFLSTLAIFKNSMLIFLLTNMMPETRTTSDSFLP